MLGARGRARLRLVRPGRTPLRPLGHRRVHADGRRRRMGAPVRRGRGVRRLLRRRSRPRSIVAAGDPVDRDARRLVLLPARSRLDRPERARAAAARAPGTGRQRCRESWSAAGSVRPAARRGAGSDHRADHRSTARSVHHPPPDRSRHAQSVLARAQGRGVRHRRLDAGQHHDRHRPARARCRGLRRAVHPSAGRTGGGAGGRGRSPRSSGDRSCRRHWPRWRSSPPEGSAPSTPTRPQV